jgi:hypothetical protein
MCKNAAREFEGVTFSFFFLDFFLFPPIAPMILVCASKGKDTCVGPIRVKQCVFFNFFFFFRFPPLGARTVAVRTSLFFFSSPRRLVDGPRIGRERRAALCGAGGTGQCAPGRLGAPLEVRALLCGGSNIFFSRFFFFFFFFFLD